MNIKLTLTIIVMVLAFFLTLPPAAVRAAEVPIPVGGGVHKSFRSFLEIRQTRVNQQRWDFSCGSAALSTLLTYYYGDKVSEATIISTLLHRVNPQKVKARGGFSLLDLKHFVESRGYEGKGYAGLSLEELAGLPVPAIVPIRVRGYDHFVVFRGVRGNLIDLADPSFGTMIMRKEPFLETWKNGIGFMVLSQNPRPALNNLAPKEEDFCTPDGSSITRALIRAGAVPLTRYGP